MKNSLLSFGAVLIFFVIALQPTEAQTSITIPIGTPHFTNGQNNVKVVPFDTAVAGQPAPFNTFCGSDSGLSNSTSCSASWTFVYAAPGFPIYGATLTLGILDIDSAAPGNQVKTFTLNGSDLTGLLNAASEGLDGGTGAPNNQYDILTINIPAADFATLASGMATFDLTLQGPGLGALGLTPSLGAGLDFSTLYIASPEISSWMLFVTGLLCFGIKRILTKLA
jgi:hypothetical protein